MGATFPDSAASVPSPLPPFGAALGVPWAAAVDLARLAPTADLAAAASLLPGLESHITGRGASKTVLPAPSSTASRPPLAVSRTSRSWADSFSRSSFSSGLAAAAADLTTRSWVKPSCCAPMRRSTSGRTSR